MILLLGLQILDVASQIYVASHSNSSNIFSALSSKNKLSNHNNEIVHQQNNLNKLHNHHELSPNRFARAEASWVELTENANPPPLYSISSSYLPTANIYEESFETFHDHSSHINPITTVTTNIKHSDDDLRNTIYLPSSPYLNRENNNNNNNNYKTTPHQHNTGSGTKHIHNTHNAHNTHGRNPFQDYYADSKEQTNSIRNSNRKFRNSSSLQKTSFESLIYDKHQQQPNRPVTRQNIKNQRNNKSPVSRGFFNYDKDILGVDYSEISYRPDQTPNCAKESHHQQSILNVVCAEDNEYPVESIQYAIEKESSIMEQMMPESGESTDLVEGMAKKEDEKYNYRHYYKTRFENSNKENKSGINQEYYKDGGFICPSYVNYIQPRRAKNTNGMWKIVINLRERFKGQEYKQTIRIEECMQHNAECSYTSNYYNSQCIQKYNNHRLIAWTPDKGIHVDIFRLPIACSCHFKGKL